jgi:hypothetical protein
MVALVTPFKPTGEIDEKALRSLLQWHIDSKTDGLVVLGTTGEVSTQGRHGHTQQNDTICVKLPLFQRATSSMLHTATPPFCSLCISEAVH